MALSAEHMIAVMSEIFQPEFAEQAQKWLDRLHNIDAYVDLLGVAGIWADNVAEFLGENAFDATGSASMAALVEAIGKLLATPFFGWSFLFDTLSREEINFDVARQFQNARAWVPRRDPLTLDLDGDGLETLGIDPDNPILFDHDGDGVKTATGWIGADDGFLVLDRNGNGVIDDGSELFGDSTPVFDENGEPAGTAADGFAALAQEDSNGDGVVDAQDARWNELRVWRDLNQDGVSQADELFTLESLGIAGLNVGKKENTTVLPDGNVIADLGTFIRADGSEGTLGEVSGELGDIDLAEDTFRSDFSDTIPLTEAAQGLPDMNGSGQVRDLREAASLSPELAAILADYAEAPTKGEQLALIDGLIAAWSDTSGLLVTGGGAYDGRLAAVNFAGVTPGTPEYDAWLEKLNILERFNGRPFANPPAGSDPFTLNLSSAQMTLLDRGYEALRQSVYDGLLLQTRLEPYLSAIELVINETGIGLDFSAMEALFAERHDTAPAEAVRDFLDLNRLSGESLTGMGWDGFEMLRTWALADATNSEVLVALAEFGYSGIQLGGTGSGASELVVGQEGADTLSGNGGNDLLLGGAGDDTLSGGTGDDLLHGGEGSDTYVFNAGDGADTILETHGDTGNDVLQFGAGISVGDIGIAAEGDHLAFVHANGAGGVTVSHWFNDERHRLDEVRFEDGRVFDLNALQLGTEDGDTLEGTGANDILMGQGGDDTLTGGEGDDWLNGGAGADVLVGGQGDDTYVVDSAHDSVTEAAGEGTDTVESFATWTLGANLENLRLLGNGTIHGTGNALDNVIAGNGAANILSGLAGNDTLLGAGGDDILDGGAGDDFMDGGSGDDSYFVESLGDTTVERAGEGVDTVYSTLSWTLADNVENLTLIGKSALQGTGNELDNRLMGNGASNRLYGLAGNDRLDGGEGDDSYLFGRGDGQDVIADYQASVNDDRLILGPDISADQLWFSRNRNDLEVAIIGTEDKVVVADWYKGEAYHIEQFETADGGVLLDSQVESLVSAMAAFEPPVAGETALPSSYREELTPVIAANWQ